MKNLKKLSRQELKTFHGGIGGILDSRKRCCAKDTCGNCVYWVSNNQLCPSVIIPAC